MWHGEKIVVGIIAVAALWFALQGLGYQGLSWDPKAIETAASDAEQSIRGSTYSAKEEDLEVFDYATYAAQIKEPISAAPYRSVSAWFPATFSSTRPSAPPSQE